MSNYPGEEPEPRPESRPEDGPGQPDQPETPPGWGDPAADEPTRPVGWQQPEPSSSWEPPSWEPPTYGQSPSYDAPDARPQSYDPPAPPASDATTPYPTPAAGQPAYGQSYGQQGYGAPQQGGYPQPPLYGHTAPEHPQALPAMLTGIIALVLGLACGIGLLASPVAWVLGSKALRRIRESGGAYGGEGMARAGQVTGIVGTVLLVLALVALVALIAIGIATAGGTSGDYGNV